MWRNRQRHQWRNGGNGSIMAKEISAISRNENGVASANMKVYQ
jgi:hypothetical protein